MGSKIKTSGDKSLNILTFMTIENWICFSTCILSESKGVLCNYSSTSFNANDYYIQSNQSTCLPRNVEPANAKVWKDLVYKKKYSIVQFHLS
jgi:hypothetical protein